MLSLSTPLLCRVSLLDNVAKPSIDLCPVFNLDVGIGDIDIACGDVDIEF